MPPDLRRGPRWRGRIHLESRRCKQQFCFAIEQHPQAVCPESGVKGKAEQIERRDNNHHGSRPGLKLEQADAADQAGERDRQYKQEEDSADAAQNGNCEGIIGRLAHCANQPGQAAKNKEDGEAAGESKPRKNDVEQAEDLNVLGHND